MSLIFVGFRRSKQGVEDRDRGGVRTGTPEIGLTSYG